MDSTHHRDWLIERLAGYRPIDEADRACHERLTAFVRATRDCLDRDHPPGHITASAWIVDPDRTSALLVHHRKLERWLQPGGHIEDDPDTLAAARREVQEETGLDDLEAANGIFDLDIHAIPARGHDPEHLHYDVRFLFVAEPTRTLRLSAESHDLRWFTFAEIARLGEDRSIERMIEKSPITPP